MFHIVTFPLQYRVLLLGIIDLIIAKAQREGMSGDPIQ